MKRSILCLFSFCILFFSASAVDSEAPIAPAADTFKAELHRVLDSKDWEGFLSLSYTEGVTDYDWKMAEMLKEVIFDGRAIQGIQLIELPEGFDSTFIYDGRFFEPTIAPVGLVEVISEGGEMKMPYAIYDGAYRLIGTKSRSLNWTGPADQSLAIAVMGQGFDLVDAHATWNASGLTIDEKLTHASTNFKGQFVESVTINSSDEAVSLQIIIFENGEKIYTSDYLKGIGELSYQRAVAE
ncbi:hypothetical protein ACWPKO_00715 [Coraliomargarita sp. W4R53]